MKGTKVVESKDYNYVFRKSDGFFARWGATKDIDPEMAPFPEIADIEITTVCKGPGNKICNFCYKANTPSGSHMDLETFQKVLDKIKPTKGRIGVTQIALGVDAQCESNPDTFAIMEACRDADVVPNVTVADITDETADKLASICGAVAVSRYENKDLCYDSVKRLTDRGLNQTNIHMMVSEETYSQAIETITAYKVDPRLHKLNAIVLLSLKTKGRGVGHTQLPQEKFNFLVDLARDLDVPIGFDSCSAHKFLKAIEGREDYEELSQLTEPCESTLFSAYISAEGKFYPCSFSERHDKWGEGLPVQDYEDFLEIWNHDRTRAFREDLLTNKRVCPLYEI
jgi:MoaA/NifB/PqqE/SkfB family radical SAM enzyme